MYSRSSIMEELRREAEELGRIERDVQEQVNRFKEDGKEIDEQVTKWLEEAHSISTNARNSCLVDEAAKSTLANRLFRRNHLSKKSNDNILKMKTSMSDWMAQGKKILHVCFPADPIGIDLVWRDGFVDFKSREFASDRILEGVKDEEVGIMGVVGMGGIGKTKLVVQIGKMAKDKKLFDAVIMATVTQNLNVRNMQGTLADMLGVVLNEENESSRADELRARFKKFKNILVLLDDVWEKVDMDSIGIPSPSNHKGCKIVLTTRREKVIEDMCCTLAVHLDVIEDAEAWALFCTYAGLRSRSTLIITKAKKVVSECAGLPLAIVTVGSALKDKSSEDYDDAVHKLSKSSFNDIESADRNVYACLKLSYDYLGDDETQKCLLLCSSYPEDSKIRVEELTRYAYGLWLFQDDQSLEQARGKIISFIKNLEKACLLSSIQEGELSSSKEEGYYVKIHDVVRDVALWITKETGPYFVPSTLKEFERKDMYEKAVVIFLDSWGFGRQFPDEFHCPNLKMLKMWPVAASVVQTFPCPVHDYRKAKDLHPPPILQARRVLHNHPPVKFTDNFFRKTHTLQVLDFEASSTVLLKYLVNLRTLHFRGQNLRNNDMSSIRLLKNLQILKLVFIGDSVVLPEWIGELRNLRLLDLSEWVKLEEIPPNLLSRLENLEELYTPLCHQGTWSDSYLCDLIKLRCLTTFMGMLTSVYSLPRDFSFRELQRYCILCYSVSTSNWSRALMLDGLKDLKVFQYLFPSVECLHIAGPIMRDIQNMYPQIDSSGFLNLMELYCHGIASFKCLIDTTGNGGGLSSLTTAEKFPRLVRLFLSEMKQLCKMCNGPTPVNFLGELRRAWFTKCPRLKNIVPDMLPCAPLLEELQIWRCHAMKYVYKVDLDALEHTTHHLPLLPFPTFIKLFHLRKLQRIWKMPNLQEKDEVIAVEACTSILENILDSLIKVEIHHCYELKEIFPIVELNNRKPLGQVSNLVELKLERLPKLKSIWKGPHENGYLHKLQRISIIGCDRLTSLFTSTLAQSLVKLQDLQITDCVSLETIITLDEQDEALVRNPHNSTSQKAFQQIKSIHIQSCHKLKSILPFAFVLEGLPEIESIYVGECAELEQVFGDREEKVVKHGCIKMNNLQSLKLVNVPRLVRLLPSNWDLSVSSLSQLQVTPNSQDKIKIEGMISSTKEDQEEEEEDDDDDDDDEEGEDEEEEPLEMIYGGKIDRQRQEEHWMVLGRVLPIRKLQSLLDFQVVEIVRCIYDVEEVFDIEDAEQSVLERLEVLKVCHLPNLKYFWKGHTKSVSLRNLREIVAFNCVAITFLFSLSTVRNLPCLESLRVVYCPQLEHIFQDDIGSEPRNYLTVEPDDRDEEVCAGLVMCFPNLKEILVEECGKVKSLFPLSIAQHLPSLKWLHIRRLFQLEHLFYEDREGICVGDNKEIIFLPKLQDIQLDNLPRLSSICPPGYVLTRMFGENWKTEVYGSWGRNFFLIRNCQPVIRRSTTLSQLVNLSHLCSFTLIESVSQLKCLFVRSMAQALCSLQRLEIVNCKELEHLIEPVKDQEPTLLRQNDSSATYFPRLMALRIVGCDKLKSVFPLSIARCLPELRYLYLNGLPELEEIFTEDLNEEYVRCTRLIKLQELLRLTLAQLPRLSRMCPLGYAVCCQTPLEDLLIGGCPLMDTSNCFPPIYKSTIVERHSIR